MEWLIELLRGDSVAHSVLILSLVAASGMLLGSVRVFGITLGVAGVLFTGLLFGHFKASINLHVLEFAREFGLILFVYTVGMQVGPGFIASLRQQGLPLNLMAASVVVLGVVTTVAVSLWGGIDMATAVGLFAGGTTNTPALGAAQQALKNLTNYTEELGKLPGLGYAIAYPFGIIGIIMTMGLIRTLFRIQPAAEAAEFTRQQQSNTPKLTTLNLVIENANLKGLPLSKVPGLTDSGVVISRIYHEGKVEVAQPDTVIQPGDVVLAVGPQHKVEEMRLILGSPSTMDLRRIGAHVTTRRVVVTKKQILGHSLDELDLHEKYGVTITRISRAEIEFTPTSNFRFQFGDTVLVVGEEADIQRVAQLLGNSPKQLNHPQVVPIFVGIALGILLGSWPFQFANVPAPVRLGLAGGPLLAAIILSRIGRIGSVVWYMPLSANFMLREVGITLFLACVGLKAGDQFLPTLLRGQGLYWMGMASLITLVPLLVVGLIARSFYKLNFMSVCGLLAGSMTDPPALAFANTISGSDSPSVAYATVYPLTMFLRVLSAQILVLFFVR
jgi:putative transport protein